MRSGLTVAALDGTTLSTKEKGRSKNFFALGLGFWSGFETGPRPGRRFAGWWCLSLEGPGLAELGYRLHRHAWGRGLASEGAAALIDHGFGTVGLERIIAETMAVNAGSRGVMSRCGLRHARTSTPCPGGRRAR